MSKHWIIKKKAKINAVLAAESVSILFVIISIIYWEFFKF